ncbi:MAG: lysophospholipid acyltransferase family protein [Streptosporangiaceae bacterium]|jgi:1-acyl-sn-glycerol-3-phosphate acyltransferase
MTSSLEGGRSPDRPGRTEERVAAMSRRQGRRYSQAWRNGTKVVLPPLIKSVMKRDWEGYQHFPREGGMIVAANHLSYADWPAMSLYVHEAGRYPAFMIKSSAFDVKLIGPFLRVLGQLPVYRGQADAALVLKDGEQALAAGECLIIYPEGTATRDPGGWPMLAKTGVARMALTTGVPVVPVAQWGAQEILPYGSTRPHVMPRRCVRMLAGPPVDLSEFEGRPLNREVLRAATNAIMGDVTGLLAELRGEQAPAAPYDPAAARRAARDTPSNPHAPAATAAPAAPPAATPENLDSATKTTPGDGPREATQP